MKNGQLKVMVVCQPMEKNNYKNGTQIQRLKKAKNTLKSSKKWEYLLL